MSKKIISLMIVLSLSVTSLFCDAGNANIKASALNEDECTYYFLAPDNFVNTNNGAANSDAGVYLTYGTQKETPDSWPGVKMEEANDIGYNVYKITVPNNDEITNIVFNSYVDPGTPMDPDLAKANHRTVDIDLTKGNHNGMIYIPDNDHDHAEAEEFSGALTYSGAWFTLDEYKNSDEYFYTYYFLAPDSFCNIGKGAANADVGVSCMKDSNECQNYKMNAAPEIGNKVFRITLPTNQNIKSLIFNDNVDTKNKDDLNTYSSVQVDIKGIEQNGKIYVFALDAMNSRFEEKESGSGTSITYSGDWFSLANYKNHYNYTTYNKFPYTSAIDSEGVYGDMDDDKIITSVDSLIILRSSIGLETLTESKNFFADVDRDEKITSADALDVLRKSVGLSTYGRSGNMYEIETVPC